MSTWSHLLGSCSAALRNRNSSVRNQRDCWALTNLCPVPSVHHLQTAAEYFRRPFSTTCWTTSREKRQIKKKNNAVVNDSRYIIYYLVVFRLFTAWDLILLLEHCKKKTCLVLDARFKHAADSGCLLSHLLSLQIKKLRGTVRNNPWVGQALSTRWIKAENSALAETRNFVP